MYICIYVYICIYLYCIYIYCIYIYTVYIYIYTVYKWDAPKDILLVSKRLQVNSEQERKHRIYRKANNEYWSSDIKETRGNRRTLLLSPNSECQENNARSTPDIQSLTIGEIKEKLKQLGVKTRARKLEKLQDILQKALKDSC